jgi:NAD(P)-dependent dehydrogenase (short-subunit alcohol dehydrogenase family)/rhamnose utilization protein RhaD (predicted bifunctional aldolase and dehydrogenase)
MDKALKELIDISVQTGSDTALVQGGGGNTSVKTDDGKYMYIKASGTALKDMNENRGWRRLDIDAVNAVTNDPDIAGYDVRTREIEVVNRLLLSCRDDVSDGSRPSVEANLHAILDKVVIHLHPSSVGALVNCKKGKEIVMDMFASQDQPVLWIPYVDPGFTLANKVKKDVEKYQSQHGVLPEILFLERHGLFVSSSTPAKAVKIVKDVINACLSRLTAPKPRKFKDSQPQEINSIKLAVRKAVFNATGRYSTVAHFMTDELAGYMALQNISRLLGPAALTPDEQVYCSGPAMWLEKVDADRLESKLKKQISKGEKPSSAFLVRGHGLFVAAVPKLAGSILDVVMSSLYIRYNADKLGGIYALTKKQRDFINNWEVEAFRKRAVTGEAGGSLKDRIAVVTGGGSGLGRSIAIGMARAGANVAIADIDSAAAQETAQMIAAEGLSSLAMVLSCNVASEESVMAGYQAVMDAWGGLDMVVNAAGVAPAFPLVDMPVDKWRFALEVNLTGYFLMAKHAARIMIEQAIGGSIINLSSKSGIEASKNNSAYNATKAGELHLARGWALELGQYGIRVNCVCPGNVFEGSKIWNPEYIKQCAKKYGIRPEEVIPYYISKSVLNKEIKGQDIADSVVFLCSDNARMITGQTIVTDAGQVFVR